MPLPVQTFAQFYSAQRQWILATSSTLYDFSTGSTLRAIVGSQVNANLMLQGQATYIMQIQRFATCKGADADSWGAQFFYYRLPAASATADCTFSRTTNTTLVNIPVGNQVSTQSGVKFQIVADPNNSNYVPATNSYTMGIGISSISLPVEALIAGADGNVGANTINVINTPIPTITSVTNPSQASGGAAAEDDSSYKSRFQNWIAYQAKGTDPAIHYAVASVQVGAYCKILKNQLPDGTQLRGVQTIVVDDGSGSTGDLSSVFVDNCISAVTAVQSCGVTYYVVPRELTDIAVTATVIVETSVDLTDAQQQIEQAVQSYIATLQIGSTVYYTKIISVIYNAIQGIVDVTGVLVNGSTLDVTCDDVHAPRCITAPSITTEYL